jgi:hypothetical protein
MRQQASDFAIEHANELPAARYLDAQKLFRRQHKGMFLVHRRDVIESIEIADRLQIGLVLDSFSVPRWSNPICGSTRRTTSPSSSKTRRKTPCAAGCCGPKLIVKFRLKGSAIVVSTAARLTQRLLERFRRPPLKVGWAEGNAERSASGHPSSGWLPRGRMTYADARNGNAANLPASSRAGERRRFGWWAIAVISANAACQKTKRKRGK